MFRFADPVFFLTLIPLCLAAWVVLSKRASSAMLFAPTHRFPASRRTWRVIATAIMPYVFLTGTALLITAMARPQTVFSRVRHHADAIAMILVIDVSGSMDALDLSTPGNQATRLDIAKDLCSTFINKRPNDLIGLVTFGGFAVTLAPLTIDHAMLLHALEGVKIPELIMNSRGEVINHEERSTAIGDALAMAAARLENTNVKSRVVIFLSDGESNAGIIKPEVAIKTARALGIKVHSIGIGSNARAPFRTRDRFGRTVIQYAQVTLDEKLMRDIAETTGGRYFHVNDSKGMETALTEIDKLEKTNVEQNVFYRHREFFSFFLVPGLLLLALAATFNVILIKRII